MIASPPLAAPVLAPRDFADLTEIVAGAAAEGRALEVMGGGSKRGWGRPVEADAKLDLRALAGITLYEPEELVLSAGAGTPMVAITQRLAAAGQELAFEPGDWGPLFGGAAESGTIGGIVASNLAGPRRVKSGAARDHLLGLRAVGGRGEAFKAGSRVMKNVTGYDLPKLLAGSFGTLAVLAEVTVKVLPAAEAVRTLLLLGLDDARAGEAMRRALATPYDVSGAAHLPAPVAARSGVALVAATDRPVTSIRVEGPRPSVIHRLDALRKDLADLGAASEELHSSNSRSFWREIADLRPFADDPERPLWRLSVAPSEGLAVVERLRARLAFDHAYDWGGGLIWIALAAGADPAADMVRGAFREGHATLVRASGEVRAKVPVFQPQEGALAALAARVKESFDPKRILNRGRMYASM